MVEIKYLKHNQIDLTKWNLCIENSFNGNTYAFSWFLDIVAEYWDALVEGDYVRVMPLVSKRKYLVDYIYQPNFTQQLGVFSTDKLSPDNILQFIQHIPANYKYVNINLNVNNKIDTESYKIDTKNNIELDLISSYETLRANYSKNTIRNIEKSIKRDISISESVTVNEILNLFKENIGDPINNLKEPQYNTLRRIISSALRNGNGKILGAYTKENSLCAAAFFLESFRKSINLISVSNNEGKNNSAMFQIFDMFIKTNSSRNHTLDFDGSNIDSIASFYKGFGGTTCNYQTLTINNLPWPIKLFMNK